VTNNNSKEIENQLKNSASFVWSEDEGVHPQAVSYNYNRLENRFAEAREAGQRWVVECRDLWDANDADAGVYFDLRENAEAVDKLVSHSQNRQAYTSVLGIFDTQQPLRDQGCGFTVKEWERKRKKEKFYEW
jgi:hypothetical protein